MAWDWDLLRQLVPKLNEFTDIEIESLLHECSIDVINQHFAERLLDIPDWKVKVITKLRLKVQPVEWTQGPFPAPGHNECHDATFGPWVLRAYLVTTMGGNEDGTYFGWVWRAENLDTAHGRQGPAATKKDALKRAEAFMRKVETQPRRPGRAI